MIELKNITKRFGNVTANENLSCTIKRNKVHGFIGENGASKSTFMKILAGFYKPDSGSIKLNGKEVMLASPSDSQKHGIGMVHQSFSLINKLTVLENVIIGDKNIPVVYSKKNIGSLLKKIITEIDLDLQVTSYIEDLNFAEMQLVEILKLLWRENDILIFDEPLSQLSFTESEKILKLIRSLTREKNKTAILVSHNIPEMLNYCDEVSILRNGKLIKTIEADKTDEKEVAKLMIGSEVESKYLANRKEIDSITKKDLISIIDLKTKQDKDARTVDLKGINISIKEGEILGLAGVKNNGQEDFLKVLFGLTKPLSGQFKYKGNYIPWDQLLKKLKVKNFIPGDPVNEGSTFDLPLHYNLLFKKVYGYGNNEPFILNKNKLLQEATEMCFNYDINPKNPLITTKNLSGGNLQKSIIAREMDGIFDLLLASNPLAGLDIKFSSKLFDSFYDLTRNKNKSIVLNANNINQLFEICDRIAVFNRGLLTGIVERDKFDKDTISLLMGGVKIEY